MKTRADELKEAFIKYHKKNPHIWTLFKRYAYEAIRAGRTRFGSRAILERIRWEENVTIADKKVLKIPNAHNAYYGRMFLATHPQYSGFLRIAKQLSAEAKAHDEEDEDLLLNLNPPPVNEDELMEELRALGSFVGQGELL